MLKTRFKELIEKDGRSQKQIAAAAQVRQNVISELVNNSRTTINRDHVERVARVLGVTDMNEIFYFEDEKRDNAE